MLSAEDAGVLQSAKDILEVVGRGLGVLMQSFCWPTPGKAHCGPWAQGTMLIEWARPLMLIGRQQTLRIGHIACAKGSRSQPIPLIL
jgi:hypothetical protein